MFIFTLEIENENAQRIAAAICARNGYNPESGIDPVEFTKRIVLDWLANQTLEHEARMASDAARDSVLKNTEDPLLSM